jgi:hypothetical protein
MIPNQCLPCLIVVLHLFPAVFWYRAMRRREAGCGQPVTAPRTTGAAKPIRGTYRRGQELEGIIIYVLEGRAGDYLSSLCFFQCVWLGWLAGTIPSRLLRASYLCAKAHTCHFPAQLTYTKARSHSLKTATRPERLTGIQELLWRMAAMPAAADTPSTSLRRPPRSRLDSNPVTHLQSMPKRPAILA